MSTDVSPFRRCRCRGIKCAMTQQNRMGDLHCIHVVYHLYIRAPCFLLLPLEPDALMYFFRLISYLQTESKCFCNTTNLVFVTFYLNHSSVVSLNIRCTRDMKIQIITIIITMCTADKSNKALNKEGYVGEAGYQTSNALTCGQATVHCHPHKNQ